MQTDKFSGRKHANTTKMKKAIFSAFVVLAALISPIAQAQFMEKLFSQTIPVTIKHPPGLSLNAEKVALRLNSSIFCDEAGNLLYSGIVNDFLKNDLEVLDRENLQHILAEQQLSTSGVIDQTSSVETGRLTGASVMLTLKANSCDADYERYYQDVQRYDSNSDKYYQDTKYFSKTSFLFRADARATDLKTGSVISARSLEYKPEAVHESFAGYPVYPATDKLQNEAINSAVWEIHKMFLPWNEIQDLVLYKAKKCNLNQTYNAVRSGSIAAALEYAEESVEICIQGTQISGRKRVKPKTLSQAYYNLGMTHMILGQHETALQHLQRAQEIRPGDLVSQAISTTQKAWDAERTLTAIEDIEQTQIEQTQVDVEEKRRAEESKILTNEQIIELAKQGLPGTIIIQLIASSRTTRFDISSAGLIALSGAGLSDEIVQAIIKKAAQQN